MVARGHSLDVLMSYPISTLNAMVEAGRYNQREQQLLTVQGMTVAVLHGLDSGFNKGKGKILKKYMNDLFPKKKPTDGEIADAGKQLLSFFSQPRKQ